jgi:hypothetical protein
MALQSHLFRLPRELRDAIYHHYLFEVDGYHFDHETGKLRASNKRCIDLALTHTCRSIATEIRNLALQINTVHFATVQSEKLRLIAGRFEMLMHTLHTHRYEAWRSLSAQFRAPETDAKIALKYPQFSRLLDDIYVAGARPETFVRPGGPVLDFEQWGDADSVRREFVHYMLELYSAAPGYAHALTRHWRDHVSSFMATNNPLVESPLLLSNVRPWIIPSEERVEEMEAVLSYRWITDNDFWKRIDWRFSAVTAAIRFLASASSGTRLAMRQVVLHEDRTSVANPECHAEGLITFCKQNPRLRVERRVNIWRTLSSNHRQPFFDEIKFLEEAVEPDDLTRIMNGSDSSYSLKIAQNFDAWMREALALPAKGMPAGSFTMVFDGNPYLGQSPEVFEMVKLDAAWQVAQDLWYARHSITPNIATRLRGSIWISEAFPQAISDIVDGRSSIRCNFPTGELYDARLLLNSNIDVLPHSDSGFPAIDLWKRWIKDRLRNRFCPSPPMPPSFWHIARERVLQEIE